LQLISILLFIVMQGLPIDPTLIQDEDKEGTLVDQCEPELPRSDNDLAYNADERPVDYGPEDLEDHHNGNEPFGNNWLQFFSRIVIGRF